MLAGREPTAEAGKHPAPRRRQLRRHPRVNERCGVGEIAAEQLVAAVAAEHDLGVAGSLAREGPDGDRRRIGQGVVRVLDEPQKVFKRQRSVPHHAAACSSVAGPSPGLRHSLKPAAGKS